MGDSPPGPAAAGMPGLALSGPEIAQLFPAYLRLDSNGLIRDAGPSLLRHRGRALLQRRIFDCVTVELPSHVADMTSLRQHRRAVILRLNGSGTMRLRGLVLDRGDAVWLMLGHIPDLDLGQADQPLRIADFSPTDGTLDMLLAADMRAGLLAETRALAAELEQQRHQADASNRAKSAFLTTMSHEIRTPMNAVLGVAAILADTEITPEQRAWLDVMVDSGRSLMELLNNILDLSKIESGAMDIHSEEFDLPALAGSVQALHAPVAAAKGVGCGLALDLAGTVYRGDPVRIRQILSNLVGNATKFTEAGEIAITLRDHAVEGAWHLMLSVQDTGIGIPAQAMKRLFNAFAQADSSTTRRYGGTGLGLSISKLLVEQMGGEISVDSSPGVGSTFTVRLPIKRVTSPAPVRPARAAPQALGVTPPRHILIVDDNATNRMILSHYLRRLGHSFDMAANGQQALAAWEAQAYDIIVMDIEMPVLDGLDTTRELRRREQATRRRYTPIIALTADAMVQKRETALAVGMDDYLTKPLELHEIGKKIQVICASMPTQDSA